MPLSVLILNKSKKQAGMGNRAGIGTQPQAGRRLHSINHSKRRGKSRG